MTLYQTLLTRRNEALEERDEIRLLAKKAAIRLGEVEMQILEYRNSIQSSVRWTEQEGLVIDAD